MDQALLSVIIAIVVTLYVTRWLPIEVTSLAIPPTLYFAGLLDLSGALSGFASSATITVAAMYILSAGLVRTGSLEYVTTALRRASAGSPLRLLLCLAVLVPLVSAIMNNTPVVVLMVPVVLTIARDMGRNPSRFMIPLSYFAILGGTCTLIGTSTNILIDELYRASGGPGFGMFEFAPMGLSLVAGGLVFFFVFGRKTLPERSSLSAILPRGRTAKFVTEIEIEPDSGLVGKAIQDIFEKDGAVQLLEVVSDETVYLAPQARERQLRAGDALLIEGASPDIAEFLTKSGASLTTVVEDDRRVPMRSMELTLGEAVVLPKSPFIGRTVADLALNRLYGVKVLAVQRRGRHHRYKIRHMYLRPGDVLLLQSDRGGFGALHESEAVLIVEGLETAIHHKGRAWIAILLLAVTVSLAAATHLPITLLALTAGALMVAARCLRFDEAVRSVDFSVILLLAGTIPLGVAMTDTGLAQRAVHAAVSLVGHQNPVLLISVLYLIVNIMTQFLSNNASAVLMTPIVLGIAVETQLDPRPFLMTVCFAASASFATPIGYQTNTIVMGPGGYTFTDYLRVGVPMTLVTWVLATILIPVFWPFQ